MFDSRFEKGFSLVELVATIIVIGILFLTVAMRFQTLDKETKAAACRANQLALQTAQTSHFVRIALENNANGKYADEIQNLIPYLQRDKAPDCPGGGEYILHSNGLVSCSMSSHNED